MKHIVALSGGKDSTAMALWLTENEPRDYEFICTPTGDELPEMIEHWRKLGELLGKPLRPLTSGMSLVGLNKRMNALPNFRMRYCTRVLKIEPYISYMLKNAPAVSYVGLRADEEERNGVDYGKAGGEVFGTIDGITQDFPLRRLGWGINDVIGYLDYRGVVIPKRSDCARCFFQRLIEWYELWRDNLAIYLDAEREEEERGHTYRSPGRDSQPASLKELRLKFEGGYIPKDTHIRTQMCRACSL